MRKTQHHRTTTPAHNPGMSQIAIPADIVVPCPMISFKGRRASKCMHCQHFQGLVDTMPEAAASTPFDLRYRIGCAHVVARRVTCLELESDDGAK